MFTPPIELNFAPKTKNEIFGLSLERAEKLVENWENIAKHANENYYEKYTIYGTGKHEGKCRLDEGKVLKEMLAFCENVNEWAFALYTADIICEDIREKQRFIRSFSKLINE